MRASLFAAALCAVLCALVSAAPELLSISVENSRGQSTEIQYNEEYTIYFAVKDYNGSFVTSLSKQKQVTLELTQWETITNSRVITPCKVISTVTTPCTCNGEKDSLTLKFPLCVVPASNYSIRMTLPYSDGLLTDPIFTAPFSVAESTASCQDGFVNPTGNGKEPGCTPCDVGTYSEFPNKACVACPEGKTTKDRASTKKSECSEDLIDPKQDFIAFKSTFFMLSNAGGRNLEAHEHKTVAECIQLCEQDGLCKAFDLGRGGQNGDCFLSYDTPTSLKERDTREYGNLDLYLKVDAQEIRNVYFRRTIDGSIKGSDAGGSFHNEHSPEACAGMCLRDPSCKSFDAGRKFLVKKTDSEIEWQPNIDNCFLSHDTKDDLDDDRWVAPNCTKAQSGVTKDLAPLDVDCDNDMSNGVDYYERIVPLFLEFDVDFDEVMNVSYVDWPDGGLTPGDADSSTTFKQEYFSPQKYNAESRTPRKGIDTQVLKRYPHLQKRNTFADAVKKALGEKIGDTSQVFVMVEAGKSGKTIAHVNTGSVKNDKVIKDNIKSVKVVYKDEEGRDRDTYPDIIDAKDMRCPDGTASLTGYGQGDTCKSCRVDHYSNNMRTSCVPCPDQTITNIGARRGDSGVADICVPNPVQDQARKGSFRAGFQWVGPFAIPLGSEAKGRIGQGYMEMEITSAAENANDDNIIDLQVFVVYRHGENCNRQRSTGATTPADNSAVNVCTCGGEECPCNSENVDGFTCLSHYCSCRDPGTTEYFLQGQYNKAGTITLRNVRYGGITDRNNWLFVPRGFDGNVVVENGNTVIKAKFQTPSVIPGNTAGVRLFDRNDTAGYVYDVRDQAGRCNHGPCTGEASQGFIRMTERCYSATEVGTFTVGDTFTGQYECYRRGVDMSVSGLNRKPATHVRQLGMQVTAFDEKTKKVTAQVTADYEDDGSSVGEVKYLVEGTYNPDTNQIGFTPTEGAWLSVNRPSSFPARKLFGTLIDQGEKLIGTVQANPNCKCKGIADSDNKGKVCAKHSNNDPFPWCYVDSKCAEAAQWEEGDLYYAPCDEKTGFQEESQGFYETCTSFILNRICRTPIAYCEPGWTLVSDTNRCYKAFSDEKSYADAQQHCLDEDAHLASIHSSTENSFVATAGRTVSDTFVWIGLHFNSSMKPPWNWYDSTPLTFNNHVKETPQRTCSAIRTGSDAADGKTNGWYTNPQKIGNEDNCDNIQLPFVCKKSPSGGKAPCACDGSTDDSDHGGFCKAWTPSVQGWNTPWCYVSSTCGRGVFDSTTKLTKAKCVDPSATTTTLPPKVTTAFNNDNDCDYKQFQNGANSCTSCKTDNDCSGNKITSRNYGDVCGDTSYFESLDSAGKTNYLSQWASFSTTKKNAEIADKRGYGLATLGNNPALWAGQGNFRDHDFTCCTPYTTKAAQCAAQGKAISGILTCRDGKDFECLTCPQGSYFPTQLQKCQDPNTFDARACKCLPCLSVCDTCQDFADRCTTCGGSGDGELFLRKEEGQEYGLCQSDCDTSNKERSFFGANNTCHPCTKCSGATPMLSASCTANEDTKCEASTTSTTFTTTTLTTTTTATSTTVTMTTVTATTVTKTTTTVTTSTTTSITTTTKTITTTVTTITTTRTVTSSTITSKTTVTDTITLTLKCPDGQYKDKLLIECQDISDCLPGTYVTQTPSENADRKCTKCLDWSYTDRNNAAKCSLQQKCQAGNSYRGAPNAQSAEMGQVDLPCQPCPSGTFNKYGGLGRCQACDFHTQKEINGACEFLPEVKTVDVRVTMRLERQYASLSEQEVKDQTGSLAQLNVANALGGDLVNAQGLSLYDINGQPSFNTDMRIKPIDYDDLLLKVSKTTSFVKISDLFYGVYDVKILGAEKDTTTKESTPSTSEETTESTTGSTTSTPEATTKDESSTTAGNPGEQSKSSSSGGGNTIIIVVVVIALLVILALIAVVVVKKRQGGTTTGAVQSFENPMYDGTPNKAANPMYDNMNEDGDVMDADGGYQDVSGATYAGEEGSGYMDVAPTQSFDVDGNDDDEDDDEEV